MISVWSECHWAKPLSTTAPSGIGGFVVPSEVNTTCQKPTIEASESSDLFFWLARALSEDPGTLSEARKRIERVIMFEAALEAICPSVAAH